MSAPIEESAYQVLLKLVRYVEGNGTRRDEALKQAREALRNAGATRGKVRVIVARLRRDLDAA